MKTPATKFIIIFKLQIITNLIVLIFLFFYYTRTEGIVATVATERQLAMLKEYGELTFITCYRKEEEDIKFQSAISENDSIAYQTIKYFYSFSNDPDDGFFYTFLMAIENKNSSAFWELSRYLKNERYNKCRKAKDWALLFEMMGNFYREAGKSDSRVTEAELKQIQITNQFLNALR